MENDYNSNFIEGNPAEITLPVNECVSSVMDDITFTLYRQYGRNVEVLAASGELIDGKPYLKYKSNDWKAGCYLLQAVTTLGNSFKNHSDITQLKVNRS